MRPSQPQLETLAADLVYQVSINNVNEHLFEVNLTIRRPTSSQYLRMAAWIPGSYLIREFCKHLRSLKAWQNSHEIPVKQLAKDHWQVACNPNEELTICYQVYGFDSSVRAAWLGHDRAFFNATALCLMVEGKMQSPCELHLIAPIRKTQADWQVATELKASNELNKNGFGKYLAINFDDLADNPVEIAAFDCQEFSAGSVSHRIVVSNPSSNWDSAKLTRDVEKICQTAITFWHGEDGSPPFDHYSFLLNCTADDRGGLEHKTSTALICSRKALPRIGQKVFGEDYTGLLGLFSHEYFHAWCVKRLRPKDLTSYHYSKENYTELLWFFEGFTSYYDDLLLAKAQIISPKEYITLINQTINQVRQTPGALVQSVAQASFDAWVKYYRPDPNTPNTTVSYYTKGSLVALCLDLTLRAENPKTNLDQVMRYLWKKNQAGPITELDILTALKKIAGRDFEHEIKDWVHGTNELPLQKLLAQFGVTILEDDSQWAQQLGLRCEDKSNNLYIKTVLTNSPASQAGFCPGDEWLALSVNENKNQHPSLWRIRRSEDVNLFLGQNKQFSAWVCRDQKLLELSVSLNEPSTTWRLAIRDENKIIPWLSPLKGKNFYPSN